MKAYNVDYNDIISKFDFLKTKTLVDIGSGSGHLLEQNLKVIGGDFFKEIPIISKSYKIKCWANTARL